MSQSQLSILSYNVQKAPTVIYSLFNSLNLLDSIDIILIHEPPKVIPNFPSWIKLLPSSPPKDELIRSIIYIKSSLDPSSYQQINIPKTGDITGIQISFNKLNSLPIQIISLYNEGLQHETFELLPDLQSKPSIVAGDLNASDPSWAPTKVKVTNLNGSFIRDFFNSREMSLVLPPDTITRPASGNTLDLVFTSISLVDLVNQCGTKEELDCGSDHLPVILSLSLSPSTVPFTPRRLFKLVDEEKLTENYFNRSNIPILVNIDSIDQEVACLESDILEAISHSVPLSKPSNCGIIWWNPRINELVKIARAKGAYYYRNQDDLTAKVQWQNAVKHKKASIRLAKKLFTKEKLGTVNPLTIWKVVKDLKRSDSNSPFPPLLKADGTRTINLEEKIILLKTSLLPERDVALVSSIPQSLFQRHHYLPAFDSFPIKDEILGGWEEASERKERVLWKELTDEEIKVAMFASSSKAAGLDQIPYSILRSLWPLIDSRVTRIYRACINLSYHPKSWKSALGVVLKKPKKDDYSLPGAYRLISLLNCLGKGLEKVLATRLAYLADEWGLLPKETFGGRAGLNCEQALLSVVDRIKREWEQKNLVLGLALDVAGAFPSVLRDKLLRNLERRGAPLELVGFIGSFMEQRTCTLLMEGIKSESMSSNSGLPQGSPLSPILYIFYNADIGPMLRSEHSLTITWIDDIFILIAGKEIKVIQERSRLILKKLFAWSKAHGSNFEPSKSHAVLFTNSDRITPMKPILLNSKPIPISEVITLLGVKLDQKLQFNQHVTSVVSRALTAFNGLTVLGGKTKGINFRFARLLFMSCVLPILDYASNIWYKPGKSAVHLKKLASVQEKGTRWITGSFAKTGLAALEVECFVLPTELRLSRNSFHLATMLMAYTPSHPLFEITELAKSNLSSKSPIARILSAAGLTDIEMESISHSPTPPWSTLPIKITIHESKELATEEHLKLLELTSTSNDYMLFYTDGSLMKGMSGAGMVCRIRDSVNAGREDEFLWKESFTAMGAGHTVYAAELTGINIALESLENDIGIFDPKPTHIYICADNQAAVLNSINTIRSPGQELRTLNRTIVERLLSNHPEIIIEFVWVPAHIGIEGNEKADVLAKLGASIDTTVEDYELNEQIGELVSKAKKVSISSSRAEFRSQLLNRWATLWKKGSTGKSLREIDSKPPSLNTLAIHGNRNRRHNSIITQLRTDSSPLNASLFKRGQLASPLCECGIEETRDHYFLKCKLYFKPRATLRKNLKTMDIKPFNLETFLSNHLAIPSTLEFIQETGRFIKYYHEVIEPAEKKKNKKGKKKEKVGEVENGRDGRE